MPKHPGKTHDSPFARAVRKVMSSKGMKRQFMTKPKKKAKKAKKEAMGS